MGSSPGSGRSPGEGNDNPLREDIYLGGKFIALKKKKNSSFISMFFFFFFLRCFLNVDHFLGVFTEVVTILLCVTFDFFFYHEACGKLASGPGIKYSHPLH